MTEQAAGEVEKVRNSRKHGRPAPSDSKRQADTVYGSTLSLLCSTVIQHTRISVLCAICRAKWQVSIGCQ